MSPDANHLSQKIPSSLTQTESLQKHHFSLDLHRPKQTFETNKKAPKTHQRKKLRTTNQNSTTFPNPNPSI